MRLIELDIPDLKLVQLDHITDERGAFVETYDRAGFARLGIEVEFVQDSWSVSIHRHTVRGLHFQAPPRAQTKLIRVARGRVWDVVVDLRHGSPHFGKYVALEMRAQEWVALLVPEGFAHGFCTLDRHTEVVYKMSDYFSPEHYMGVRWNDPDLGIEWPVQQNRAILSSRDRRQPHLAELPPVFEASL